MIAGRENGHAPELRVNLADVRTHLQQGEGGVLSPTVLAPSGKAGQVEYDGPLPHMSPSEADPLELDEGELSARSEPPADSEALPDSTDPRYLAQGCLSASWVILV